MVIQFLTETFFLSIIHIKNRAWSPPSLPSPPFPLPSIPFPSIPLLSIPLPSVTFFTSVPTVNKHLPVVSLRYRTLHHPQIFAGLSKHLPVFLLGTETSWGGWMAILVVVCGKICGKMCGKIEKLSDWNKNWYGSKKKNSVQGVGGAAAGGGIGGGPI